MRRNTVRAAILGMILVAVAGCFQTSSVGRQEHMQALDPTYGLTRPTVTFSGRVVRTVMSNGDEFSISLDDLIDIDGATESPDGPDAEQTMLLLKGAIVGLVNAGKYDRYELQPGQLAQLLREVKLSKPFRITYPEHPGHHTNVLLALYEGKLLGAARIEELNSGGGLIDYIYVDDLDKAPPLELVYPAIGREGARQAAEQLVPGFTAQSVEDQELERVSFRTEPYHSWFVNFYWRRKGQSDRFLVRADGTVFETQREYSVQSLDRERNPVPVREIGRYRPRGGAKP